MLHNLNDDDTDLLPMRIQADTQYHLPVYEAMVSTPKKGLFTIAVVVGLSFFGLRWLMKGSY
jgi:hypothetical protein